MLRKIQFLTLVVVDNVAFPMRGFHHQVESYLGNGFSLDAIRALLNIICNFPSESGPLDYHAIPKDFCNVENTLRTIERYTLISGRLYRLGKDNVLWLYPFRCNLNLKKGGHLVSNPPLL